MVITRPCDERKNGSSRQCISSIWLKHLLSFLDDLVNVRRDETDSSWQELQTVAKTAAERMRDAVVNEVRSVLTDMQVTRMANHVESNYTESNLAACFAHAEAFAH